MVDAVIAAHEAAPAFFLLSGPAPISIRDQLLRAYLLIDRLDKRGRLLPKKDRSPADHDVIVIGGGGTGASAALEAAKRGARTLLIEKESNLFTVQLKATSRWVCPTQYDWPLWGFETGKFHGDGEVSLPLVVSVGTGFDIAMAWAPVVTTKSEGLPLTFDYDTEIERIVPEGQTLRAIPMGGSGGKTAHIVIWAAGFGKESVEFGPVKAVPFWGADNYQELRKDKPPPKVLISGSGDGALQDFLRVTTGLGLAREILRVLRVPEVCAREIESAETRMMRAQMWNEPITLAPYMAELQRRYVPVVEQALENKDCREGFKELFSEGTSQVVLVYPESFLKAAYPLNRFLTLLIRAWFNEKEAKLPPQKRTVQLRPETRLRAVEENKRGKPYQASFSEPTQSEGRITWTPHSKHKPEDFDIIIPRHGFEGNLPEFEPLEVAGVLWKDIIRFSQLEADKRAAALEGVAVPKDEMVSPFKKVAPPFAWHALPVHLPL